MFCKKRDRKSTEQALLLAASRLFAQKGYEGTRTLEIAKEAGANEALIGRYFGGKEGLLIALIKNEDALNIMIKNENCPAERFDEHFPSYNGDKTLKETLKEFFATGCETMDFKEDFIRITLSRALVDAEVAAIIKKKIIHNHLPLIASGLKTYPELKHLKVLELDAIAYAIMTQNFAMNFLSKIVYGMDEQFVNQSIEAFVNGLCSQYTDATKPSSRKSDVSLA